MKNIMKTKNNFKGNLFVTLEQVKLSTTIKSPIYVQFQIDDEKLKSSHQIINENTATWKENNIFTL